MTRFDFSSILKITFEQLASGFIGIFSRLGIFFTSTRDRANRLTSVDFVGIVICRS
jgi:hypothetical protein